MTNLAFHLYQLQKIDSRQDLINDRLNMIQSLISNDKRVIQATDDVNHNKTVLADLQTSLQSVENLIQAKRLKIEQSESSLYGGSIKNPKELQDLQKEISNLKSSVQSLEEKQLNFLLEIEEQEKRIASLMSTLSEIARESGDSARQLNLEADTLISEGHRLKEEKGVILSQLPTETAAQYKTIRNQKKGVAVATIVDQTCSACGSTLTPSDCQLAKSPTSITFCKSCNRILYAG